MTMNAIIAVNPMQMQQAQATTTGWIGAKLEDARRDLALASETMASLSKAGLRTEPAKVMRSKAIRRVAFYEKVKAALEAGYYIIPPFDIQLFAVRTDRTSPNEVSRSSWAKEQVGRSLPAGEGNYVNPVVGRHKIGTETEKRGDGTTYEVAIYRNSNWQDGIDLPIRAMKPQIIEEVGRALELKIFDALGIAPAYRAADPIIAGQIRRPDGKGVLTFFVAWWLDEQDL
jgi:hypothetical protein